MLRLSLALTFLCLTTTAQELVFPQPPEGNTHGTLPGVWQARRAQILLPAARLTALANHTVEALTFRRDGRLSASLPGGSFDLTLRLATSPRAPREASPAFADNLANTTTVFTGRIAVPAAPPISGSASFNDPLQTIHIPFTVGFAYTAGTLVLDLHGNNPSAPNDLWPIDYALDRHNAVASTRGVGCGRWSAPRGETAAVAHEQLLPGGTARFVTWTNAYSPALLILGVIPTSFDLSAFGATGCHLYADPMVTLLTAAADRGSGPGIANLRLQLPAVDQLLGSSLIAQWAHLEVGTASNPLGLTTSNALDLTLATSLPTLGSAMVTSLPTTGQAIPTHGDVSFSRAPVLRLSYR
jgi:hypothetical protein